MKYLDAKISDFILHTTPYSYAVASTFKAQGAVSFEFRNKGTETVSLFGGTITLLAQEFWSPPGDFRVQRFDEIPFTFSGGGVPLLEITADYMILRRAHAI